MSTVLLKICGINTSHICKIMTNIIIFRYLTFLGLPLNQHSMSVSFYEDVINVASLHKPGISQKTAVCAVHTTTCVSKQRMVSLACTKVSMSVVEEKTFCSPMNAGSFQCSQCSCETCDC
jgi:hypothetical protein